MSPRDQSEDEIGTKYDRCLTSTLVKTLSGVGVGAFISAIAFKKKSWPVALFGGLGFGMAVSDCRRGFRGIYPTATHGRPCPRFNGTKSDVESSFPYRGHGPPCRKPSTSESDVQAT